MTNTVTFRPEIGGDGSTVTDDSNATTGLANGGFRVRLLPMFTQIINIANWMLGQATNAAQSATSAASSASNAQSYAAAAQSAAGVPALAGHANAVLQVKPDASGVQWSAVSFLSSTLLGAANGVPTTDANNQISPQYRARTGDIIRSAVNPGASYLPCDGSAYLQSAYPTLFAALGTVPTGKFTFTSLGGSGGGNIQAVAYGNGLYIGATASNGYAITSPDGVTWTLKSSMFGSYAANSLVFGKGLFVAGCSNGYIVTSPDGATWTNRGAVAASSVNRVRLVNGLFIACGYSSTGPAAIISTSPDGVTWTQRYSVNLTAGGVQDVAYGNGIYVAVSSSGYVLTSTDAVTWTQKLFTSTVTAGNINSITFGNGRFVMSGVSGLLATSVDGVSWSQGVGVAPDTSYGQVTFFGGLFVAGLSTLAQFVTSADGLNWLATPALQLGSGPDLSIVNNTVFMSMGSGIGSAPLFTYNTATQFAVPNILAGNGATSYIRT